jgi:predicted phosphodiesterase
VKVVFISDTHMNYPKVPDGDLLIHAGDALSWGSDEELVRFVQWFGNLPHRHKVYVAGNHDVVLDAGKAGEYMQVEAEKLVRSAAHYLHDSGVVIDGLSIYGSPYQPWFCNWAFNLPRRGPELAAKWSQIPAGLDILVTHGPPALILDSVGYRKHAGCELLREAVITAEPRIHVFGHIHGGYGVCRQGKTVFVNASVCDEQYRPVNKPVVMDIDASEAQQVEQLFCKQ